jgi:23S rRNA pseudouridine2605 synthase
VRVDGRVAQLGDHIALGQVLSVDHKQLNWTPTAGDDAEHENAEVIIYHKPEQELCTRNDPKGRRTVFDGLSERGVDTARRLLLVGRLDYNTSGLLLLTDSGVLANQIAHPSHGLQREYLCRVHGNVTPTDIKRLLSGVVVDGKRAKFLRLQRSDDAGGANQWFKVVLGEGRYREVRKLWQAVGGTVTRLKRIRFGPQELPRRLRPGQWRSLSRSEVDALWQAAQADKS